MINHEYLEKYCIDKVNEIAKDMRNLESHHKKNSTRYIVDKSYMDGSIDAYNTVLSIIAQEVAYAKEQDNVC